MTRTRFLLNRSLILVAATLTTSLQGAGDCETGCQEWTGRFWLGDCHVYIPGTCITGLMVPAAVPNAYACGSFNPLQKYDIWICNDGPNCTNSCDLGTCPNRSDCHHTGTIDANGDGQTDSGSPNNCVLFAANQNRTTCQTYY